MWRRTFGIGMLWAGLLLAGCGGDGPYPVHGVVLLNGKPVDRALVTFEPEGDAGPPATGWTREDGSFTLTCAAGSGALRGEYRILVSKLTGPNPPLLLGSADEIKRMQKEHREQCKSWLPDVYGSRDDTPLRWSVPFEGTLYLELKSKSGT